MNKEIINAFIQNTVFTNKKIDKSIWKALMTISNAKSFGDEHEDVNIESFVYDIKHYVGENTALIQNLIPVEYKAGKKAPSEVIGRFCSSNDSRRTLEGVFHDSQDKKFVATNGKYVALCDMKEDTAESKVVGLDGKVITGTYPNYKQVIPQKFSHKDEILDVQKITGYLKAIVNFSSCIGRDEIVLVNLFGNTLNAELLYTVFKTFSDIGAKTIQMRHNNGEGVPVLFETDNLTVVLMPARVNTETTVIGLADEKIVSNKNIGDFNIRGNKISGTYLNPLKDFKIIPDESELRELRIAYNEELVMNCCEAVLSSIIEGSEPDAKRIAKSLKKAIPDYASDETLDIINKVSDAFKSIKTLENAIDKFPSIMNVMSGVYERIHKLHEIIGQPIEVDVILPSKIEEMSIKAMLNKGLPTEVISDVFKDSEKVKGIISMIEARFEEELKKQKEMEAMIPEGSEIIVIKCGGELWFKHPDNGIFKSIEEVIRHDEFAKRQAASHAEYLKKQE